MKKLCLVYPNQRWYKNDSNTVWDLNPVTLCLLATMVKDLVEVKIIDAQFYDISREEFKNQLNEFNPDFVGISILYSEYEDTLDIIKNLNNTIVTIAGGVHVTTKHNHAIDFGELT